MYFVGIDIAKFKHDCFICTSEGVTVSESFSFDNSNTGFKQLQSALDHLDHSQHIKIGLEATGIYGKNLKLFLSSIGYEFHELNPLLVKRFHDSLSNRKTKTDKIDARTIPGISTFCAATIIGEFGDLSKFSDPKQLCAFCGVEPSIYQSGTSCHTGKMVKHGSSQLRYVLFNAVQNSFIRNFMKARNTV